MDAGTGGALSWDFRSGSLDILPLLGSSAVSSQEGRLRDSVAVYERCSFIPLASGLFAGDMSIPRWCWERKQENPASTPLRGLYEFDPS